MQRFDFWHWHGQDDQIREQIESRIAVPERGGIDTSPLDLPIPRAADGDALEDGSYDACCCIGDDDVEQAYDISAESRRWKDAEIEKKDRGFGEVDCAFVDDLENPEGLVSLPRIS